LDKGKDRPSQIALQKFNHTRRLALEAGMRDLLFLKQGYDEALVGQKFESISYYVIEFGHALEMVCTIGFTPEVDFNGNRLQTLDLSVEHLSIMTCSITKTTEGSAIVFAWFEDFNGACSNFISSLDSLKSYRVPSAIVSLIFEHGENVFFSQSWWEGLSLAEQARIEERANSFHDKPGTILEDDGKRPVLWAMTGKKRQFNTRGTDRCFANSDQCAH